MMFVSIPSSYDQRPVSKHILLRKAGNSHFSHGTYQSFGLLSFEMMISAGWTEMADRIGWFLYWSSGGSPLSTLHVLAW
jgi:hypothetical protein